MTQHQMPTHLSVEDKMFWRLSARQVGILVSGGSSIYWAWQNLAWLPQALNGVLVVLIAILAVAIALIRPYGRGLDEWAFAWLRYAAMPRSTVWRVAERVPTSSAATRTEWETWEVARHWKGDRP